MPHRNGLRRVLRATAVSVVTSVIACGSLVATAPGAAAETTDSQAPAMTSLVVEPSTVDASQDAVAVVVTAHVTDALSGTAQALVRLGGSTVSVDLNPLSGTAQDGQWSGIATVPAGTPAGPVDTDITVIDVAGNSTSSASPAVQSVAGPTPAAATTLPSAPAIESVSAGNAAATLAWSAPAVEGVEPAYAFLVTATASGRQYVLPGSARSATVGRLTNGTATTFTIAALNSAGSSPESAASAPVTPRLPGSLVVLSRPAATTTYGTSTGVRVDLRTAGDVSVGGRPLELLARVVPSTTWRRVATASTDATGQAVLRAVLPATSALRVRHLDDVVHAPAIELGTVTVATRLSALPRASRIRQGGTVSVTGAVAPPHPTGSVVRLQQRTTTGWTNVASGRMTSTTAYAVSWKPTAVASYALRVIKPADADHVTGTSAAFTERVDPEIVLDVARAIRANTRITLADVHEGGQRDLATARLNLADLAAGRLARRSSYGNAPGGSTAVDLRLVKALRRMGQLGTVTVSEVAGGSHAGRSAHYYGKGLDVTYVNGVHVRRGSSYSMVVSACKAFGAVQVFSPSNDPYGGHQNHVHCGW